MTTNMKTMTTVISQMHTHFRSGGIQVFGTQANGEAYEKGVYVPKSALGSTKVAVGDRVRMTFAPAMGGGGWYLRASELSKVRASAQAGRTRRARRVQVRKLDAEVVSVKATRHGYEFDLGYDAPAYVTLKSLQAEGVNAETLEVGAKLSGEYRMLPSKGSSEGARYASLRIVEATPAG